jgi:hypothetical protein
MPRPPLHILRLLLFFICTFAIYPVTILTDLFFLRLAYLNISDTQHYVRTYLKNKLNIAW